MFDDESEISEEEKQLLEELKGKPFKYLDLSFSIFENRNTFPHSIAFLIKIPLEDTEAGVVIVTNPQRGTYVQRAFKNRQLLNEAYRISKKKIINRGNIILAWEGACLLNGYERLN